MAFSLLLAISGSVVLLEFLAGVKSIITPFVMAAFVAFLLNPIVTFLTRHTKLPRLFIIITVFISSIVALALLLWNVNILLTYELREFGREWKSVSTTLDEQLTMIPEWSQSVIHQYVRDGLSSFLSPKEVWPFLTGALSSIESVVIFLLSTFYFLKDGQQLVDYIKRVFHRLLPPPYKERIYSQVRAMLPQYIRGQLILVLIMSTATWLSLWFLGVRFSLLLGIFTGLAEIVPIIGPITAGLVASMVAIFDGNASFGAPPVYQGLMVACLYFVLRYSEDLFIIPYVLGKTVKLHPLLILFGVLIGAHFWGVLGMIGAIPALATVKIVIENILALQEEKGRDRDKKRTKD